jgi:CopG family nickel-responsive transcriptional regulator
MSELVRFGVSLEKSLLDRFDLLIREQQYTNRSEALRDLIRQELVQREWREGGDVAGAITLIYDHHKRDVMSKVTDTQHARGKAEEVQKLADALRSIKGVRHTTLSMSSTGREIK